MFGEATTGRRTTSRERHQSPADGDAVGMSERLGPRTFGSKESWWFLGREISESRNYSDKVAEEIDEEVGR